jgi:hypothetical protein
MSVQISSVAAEHMQQQQFSGERVGRHIGGAKLRDASFQCCANVHRVQWHSHTWL